jgi:tetratricopeptide (TPR) repeat protein
MTNAIKAEIQQMLDRGDASSAARRAIESVSEITDEPRILLGILDALDKQRGDAELIGLAKTVEAAGILKLESLIFRLRAQFRASDYVSALQTIDRILKISDRNVEALRTGGRIGNLTRDDDTSLRFWESLAAAVPNDAEAGLQAARICLRRKQFSAAFSWAQQAIDVSRDANEPLQIAVSAGASIGWPKECDRHLARLFLADRAKAVRTISSLVSALDASTAARLLAFLRVQFPEDVEIRDIADKMSVQWLVAGMEKELASTDVGAATYYCAIRKIRPQNPDSQTAIDRLSKPHLLAMRDAFLSRDFSEAVAYGQVVTRLDPENFEAWQTIGRCQFATQDFSSAVESFRNCIELHDKDPHAWINHGMALNQVDDRIGALSSFRQALNRAHNSESKREATSSIEALRPYLLRDVQDALAASNLDVAWKLFAMARSAWPTAEMEPLRQPLLRQTREAIRGLWQEQSPKAVDLCRRYLEVSPNDSSVQTVLARTLMNQRAYDRALPVWESLCALNPADARAHLQVARCCRVLKMPERGLSAARRALALETGLQEATEIVLFLTQLQDAANVR